MKNWKRITLVIFLLIGSVTFFSYWTINQFNQVFDNLSASYVANTQSVYPSLKQNAELASTSPETPEMSVIVATSTDSELSFTFPKKDTKVYIGCTYPISWQSSTMINSLEAALIDAGIREDVGSKTSGLAKENTIEKNLKNLNWKVGFVLPGTYYIKVSKINGVEAEFRSNVFEINKMSENISTSEKEDICKGSGGSF